MDRVRVVSRREYKAGQNGGPRSRGERRASEGKEKSKGEKRKREGRCARTPSEEEVGRGSEGGHGKGWQPEGQGERETVDRALVRSQSQARSALACVPLFICPIARAALQARTCHSRPPLPVQPSSLPFPSLPSPSDPPPRPLRAGHGGRAARGAAVASDGGSQAKDLRLGARGPISDPPHLISCYPPSGTPRSRRALGPSVPPRDH